MRSLVDEVKDRLDIAEVVSGYVKLTSAGANMKGLCPFHREKTPSFMVNRDKQIFHCFGCGKGGDVISFIQEMEGLEFKEALKILAERAGLEYRKWQGAGAKADAPDSKETLRRIAEATAVYYQKNLDGPLGERAKKYLSDRGVSRESSNTFRLGYAPLANDKGFPTALFDYLGGLGFPPAAILASGSVYKKEGREVYVDRFRDRIIFPIADSLGRIVGFSARLLPGSDSLQGKYINTPGTVLYDKSSLLYGFHLAKTAIRESGEVIMLEGNLDVVLSHQAGVRQAVATCGTALGKKQLVFARRYAQKLVLAFDADMAGVKATKRAAEIAWQEGLDVKVLPIKGGKDVADIVKDDPRKWQTMVNKKRSVAGYFFSLAFKNRKLNIDQEKVLADKILKLLAQVPSLVERSHYVKLLAEEVRVPEAHLWEKISSGRNLSGKYPAKANNLSNNSSGGAPKGRELLLEERLIGLLYSFPKLYFKYLEKFDRCVFSGSETKHIFEEIKKILEALSEDNRSKVKSSDLKFTSRDLFLKVSELALSVEKDLGKDQDEIIEKAEDELKICLSALEKEFLKNQRIKLLREIKQAQKEGGGKKMEELIKRLQSISQAIAN